MNYLNQFRKRSIVNSTQIQAVLTLLICNATNSKCSEISVKVDLLPSANQKTNYRILQLIVFDNGIGISAEKVKKINNELRNLHIKSYTVLGSELLLVKPFIHEMTGKIKLESKQDKYTAFTCSIPIEVR
ncbi:ATP-binding protein [Orientia tsutsugamushi]|uniref:Histidine kinase-, DNA gyrase B-, and HSP90-like ATPase family protein n=2 Tax=Orientia tsutsugamushi str. TA716 TaxID=1359175 RepID=A0A0F3NQ83_ORITS|nr:ATP-binding protein [Orientia tsutsugamushi]KJV70230.1 histidine kinase-, DNA gyrase B-, and HSP90-like ATPase family protein [Orientia tsutsugamushi str. TA716]